MENEIDSIILFNCKINSRGFFLKASNVQVINFSITPIFCDIPMFSNYNIFNASFPLFFSG